MKDVTILGSTGSIGTQTLDVIQWHSEDFTVKALAAGKNWQVLAEQAKKFAPSVICIADDSCYSDLKAALPDFKGEILCGEDGVLAVAAIKVDLLVHCIAGMAGLKPLFEAIKAGNKVAFANKESLVTAGHIVMPMVKEYNTVLLPVDSEHSAIFQCLEGGRSGLDKLVLTASGGPFRNIPKEELAAISPADALAHPTWNMGAKVTIDSSTMMNKGLEIIEAHWLFDVDYSDIDVLIQPQSIIHSMVSFKDGSFLAHLGKPDMRIPIQYALTYPYRQSNPLEPLDFAALGKIEFFAPDYEKFPLLKLAIEVGQTGGILPAVMNAANEILVYKFLNGSIKYTDIFKYTAFALESYNNIANPNIEEIFVAQEETKALLNEVL